MPLQSVLRERDQVVFDYGTRPWLQLILVWYQNIHQSSFSTAVGDSMLRTLMKTPKSKTPPNARLLNFQSAAQNPPAKISKCFRYACRD